VEETLQHLGLPPNREGDYTGFLMWETDGKITLPVVATDSHPIAYCMVPSDAAPASESSDRKREAERELVSGAQRGI
jgi:hypothetical protein